MSTVQIFCRMPVNWNLPDCFEEGGTLGLWVLGRRITEIKCHFHHTISKVNTNKWAITFDFYLDHLSELVFVRFLLYEGTLFSPQYCTLLKEVIVHGPHLRSGELSSTSVRMKYLHKLFGMLLYREFVSFPLIYSIIYVSIDWWIFIWYLGYNLIGLYFMLKIFQLWPL